MPPLPLADVAEIHPFRDKDRFASCNGTAPLGVPSGTRQRHRQSRALPRYAWPRVATWRDCRPWRSQHARGGYSSK